MTTIVIADDEKLIRAGIKKILTDEYGPSIVVKEARNGNEAYELCLAEQPEVLVTDIKMPGMDGVELMGKVKELSRKPSIIVLSGFDDFSYAKAAISSGASAYILKPVDTKELITAVNKALDSAREIEKNENEKSLRKLVDEGVSLDGLSFNSQDFPGGMICVTVCGFHGEEFLRAALGNGIYYIIEQKKDNICVVTDASVCDIIRRDEKLSACVTGVSMTSSNASELRKLKRESFSAILQSFFSSPKHGLYYFDQGNGVTDFSEYDTRYEKVTASIDLLSAEEIKKSLDTLINFDDVEQDQKAECLRYVYNTVVNNLLKRYPKFNDTDTYLYLKSLMIENITQVDTIEEWKQYVVDYVLYLVELLRSQQGKYAYITKAIAYINRHYAENITMATVANYVSMNYTWFSEKFKEQVGVNFNDYLKRYRMEQAKKLLEMGTYKVYEVAEKTGFKDVKHFMKSFREMNGMSAGEWAKIHSSL